MARHDIVPPKPSTRWAVPGAARGMTSHVYRRKYHSAVRASGARLAVDCRFRPLSRLAPLHYAQERSRGSQEAFLHLQESGQCGSAVFRRWIRCSPRPPGRFCLAARNQRRPPNRGKLPFGKVGSGHPTHPLSVLFGGWFLARTSGPETSLPTFSREDRQFAGDLFAARHHHLALFAPGRSASLRGALRAQSAGCRSREMSASPPFTILLLSMLSRYEARAFDLARASPMNMD